MDDLQVAHGNAPRLCLGLHNWSKTPPPSWRYLLDRAVAADDAGVDQLVVSDHVVFGENLEAYARSELGGRDGGRQPTGSDGVWLEPLTLLSMVAGMTSRIRLATGILLAALRRPVVLAKTAATLDVLSEGRLELGVGVGWQREEYDAAGLVFEDRGHLLDHTLSVCLALWRATPASVVSRDLSFNDIYCVPRPQQPGGVPIWVSGTLNPRVLSRITRFADGWMPWGPLMIDPTPGIGVVRAALRDADRDPEGFMVRAILRVARTEDGVVDLAATMQPVPRLHAAGVTHFLLEIPLPRERDEATQRLREAVGEFRSVAS